MGLTSPEMKEIGDAISILHQGEKQLARVLLLQHWEKHSTKGTPLQLCTMAHFLADIETDVTSELEWDLRALQAATGSSEAEDREASCSELASFLPFLHLNVGDCYSSVRSHRVRTATRAL